MDVLAQAEKMKRSYYLLPIFMALFPASCLVFSAETTVTFKIIPRSMPPGSKIYITGNHGKLGNWDPDDIVLEHQVDGHWIKTVSFAPGTQLEYKITRGSWETEMVDVQGIEFSNFVLMVKNDTTISIDIPYWRDIYQGTTVLSLERMQNKAGIIELFENWKFHPGDDHMWAQPLFDDGDWHTVDPRLPPRENAKIGWHGIGWFRIHLEVDSSLWHRPLSLMMKQAGALEIYLNGKLLYQFGTVGTSKIDEIAYEERNPRYILFDNQQYQVLAVRYSNFSADFMRELSEFSGFVCALVDLNQHMDGRATEIRIASTYQMIFTAVPIVLAFLHLLLFLFYQSSKENLYYTICMIGFSVMSYANFHFPFTRNFEQTLFYQRLAFIALNLSIVFGLLTAYASTLGKIPKHFILLALVAGVFVALAFIQSWINVFVYFNIYLVIAAIELLRVIFRPGYRKKKEWEWWSGIAFIILILAVAYQIMIDRDILEPIGGNRVVYVYGILALSIAISINLARDFARMNQKIIQQERQAKEQEIERRLLEADNARKTAELEQARQLQLSLLPNTVPKLSHLDIAVYMKTATEVGGDYYDFHVGVDGTLTVAIGDATGHGMKAGNMVISIKSLFNALPPDLQIPDFFNRCTGIIRRMNLGQLYMCLALVRIQEHQMIASAAGMPPILIYRNEIQDVEEILVKGMPLGAVNQFAYEQIRVTLKNGDTILLMSDGFPELFNEKKEILDYPRAKDYFKEVANQSPEQIISYLNDRADQWRCHQPQEDDITFVVLKVREGGTGANDIII